MERIGLSFRKVKIWQYMYLGNVLNTKYPRYPHNMNMYIAIHGIPLVWLSLWGTIFQNRMLTVYYRPVIEMFITKGIDSKTPKN